MQSLIYNGTIETLIWSKMWRITSFFWLKKCLFLWISPLFLKMLMTLTTLSSSLKLITKSFEYTAYSVLFRSGFLSYYPDVAVGQCVWCPWMWDNVKNLYYFKAMSSVLILKYKQPVRKEEFVYKFISRSSKYQSTL